MRGWIGAAGLVAIALAGCATPESRIAAALTRYGVPEQPARCMAGSLVDQLSKDQLRTAAEVLRTAERAGDIDLREVKLGQALDLVGRAGDPAIASAAVRAGTACMMLHGR